MFWASWGLGRTENQGHNLRYLNKQVYWRQDDANLGSKWRCRWADVLGGLSGKGPVTQNFLVLCLKCWDILKEKRLHYHVSVVLVHIFLMIVLKNLDGRCLSKHIIPRHEEHTRYLYNSVIFQGPELASYPGCSHIGNGCCNADLCPHPSPHVEILTMKTRLLRGKRWLLPLRCSYGMRARISSWIWLVPLPKTLESPPKHGRHTEKKAIICGPGGRPLSSTGQGVCQHGDLGLPKPPQLWEMNDYHLSIWSLVLCNRCLQGIWHVICK